MAEGGPPADLGTPREIGWGSSWAAKFCARRGGRRRTSIVLTAIGVTVGLLAASGSVSANHDLFRRISTGTINGNGAFGATFAGASADGTRVFFTTQEQLRTSDTDSN